MKSHCVVRLMIAGPGQSLKVESGRRLFLVRSEFQHLSLSLHDGHVRHYLVVLSKVSLTFDSLVEKSTQDYEE